LNGKFSFCHVDGGHSRAETLHDLELSTSLLVPGGLVALDDYFNPEFPGVCEGAIEFWTRHPKVLRPVALLSTRLSFKRHQRSSISMPTSGQHFRRYPTRSSNCGRLPPCSSPPFSGHTSI
jgi:hypothetical protein